MKTYRLPIFLIVLVIIFYCTVISWAEGVYYTPEGKAIKTYSVPKLIKKEKKPSVAKENQSKKEITEQKTATQKKIKPSAEIVDPKKDKAFPNPSEAAAAGYKIGQSVMVKNGIIYKLAIDSNTGQYKYKRYRKVKKNPMNKYISPLKAAAVGYKVGQTVIVKNGIIYKLAHNSKTGRYKYKRYRVVKPKPESPKTTPQIQKQLDTDQPPAVVKDQSESETKKAAVLQNKTQEAARLKEKPEVHAQEKVSEKSKTENIVEEKTKSEDVVKEQKVKQERVQKEKIQKPEKSSTSNGRNMNRFKAAVAFRHSFLDRKTVITDRDLTQSGVTTPITTDVGKEDTFFTDMHSDSLRLRLGITDTIEVFLDAGVAYDKFSEMSDMEPAYGFGFRYNITTVDTGRFSGMYLALTSEYLTGKLTTGYSSGGLNYSQETDWEDMTATVESGIVLSKVTVFGGISYMLYSESIDTEQVQSSPTTTKLEEELEQQESINLSGGIEYRYSPKLNFQLEVQTPNRQGAIISVEYRF